MNIMIDHDHAIARLAREDGRFHVDAYLFVFDALGYARDVMQLSGDETVAKEAEEVVEDLDTEEDLETEEESEERHLTGQQLCEAIRRLALDHFGYMAKLVFNQWGVTKTDDFGAMVFNLIEIGQMRKTEADRLEDFQDVFDFDRDLVEQFKITSPESGLR